MRTGPRSSSAARQRRRGSPRIAGVRRLGLWLLQLERCERIANVARELGRLTTRVVDQDDNRLDVRRELVVAVNRLAHRNARSAEPFDPRFDVNGFTVRQLSPIVDR